MIQVKICGIHTAAALAECARLSVDYVGLVFHPPSPRAVTPAQAAALFSAPGGPSRVGLFVDADDITLAATLAALRLDILQLHGSETPGRCAAIRARFGLPVMKALGIGGPADLAAIAAYAPVVDRFLFDAKPTPSDPLPGGNAHAFEWRLLAGQPIPRPWRLAGGLTPGNVAAAITASGAPGVDVSSGVEAQRGEKSVPLIAAFTQAARTTDRDNLQPKVELLRM